MRKPFKDRDERQHGLPLVLPGVATEAIHVRETWFWYKILYRLQR